MSEQHTTDPTAPVFINRLPIEDLRQLASLDTVHKRFIAEIDRLTEENRKLDRDADQLIGERDQAQQAADKLAYAIAPVETIGEHSDHNDPWDNAHEELHRQRQELADTAMMRDFNQRSAEHIAAKRDLAEAAIAAWDRGEISADAAILIVRKSLADGPVAGSESSETAPAPICPVCQNDPAGCTCFGKTPASGSEQP